MHDPDSSLHQPLSSVAPRRQSWCPPPPSDIDTLRSLPWTRTRIAPQLETIIKTALEFRDFCAATGRVNKEETETMNDAWKAAHAEQTRAWAEDAFSAVRDAVAKIKSTAAAGQPAKGKKPVFNHEYTPLLEKYFEHNAYPSALDRSVLARKSMMTSRQIEVWFQNHRNRARKDGKPLRKLTEDPLPLDISFKSLERKMPFYTIPEHERKPSNKQGSPRDDSSDEEDTPSISRPSLDPTSGTALSPPRPPHAFPTMYPPRCSYDPFPIKTGAHKFPPPLWFRKPATSHRTSKTAVNMDDFIADFDTKLHLRAPVFKKRRSKLTQTWCASRATLLPPAPHPALVRSFVSFPTTHIPRFPIVAAPSPRPDPFRSSCPYSQTTTLVPPQNSNNTPIRRKVARLPKRTPKNTSIAHRHDSPAISEASLAPSRSSSIASRSTSFGSELSTDRRPSSSSNNLSSPTSELATPERSHAILPDDRCSPSVSVSGIDFNNVDDLFGNSRRFPSPEGSMPFTFSVAAQSKNPFGFGFKVPSARGLESEQSSFRSCVPVS